jgi:hypothetical protein
MSNRKLAAISKGVFRTFGGCGASSALEPFTFFHLQAKYYGNATTGILPLREQP